MTQDLDFEVLIKLFLPSICGAEIYEISVEMLTLKPLNDRTATHNNGYNIFKLFIGLSSVTYCDLNKINERLATFVYLYHRGYENNGGMCLTSA